MVLSAPPITRWGHPSASRRALCLHPMTSCSQCWHHIAKGLVAQDYVVVAPDLLGHGMAPSSTDYTLKTTAEAVLPLLSASEPFDLVVGSSWGAIVALALLPHLPDSVRAVLVDPPMELTEEVLEGVRKGALMEMASVRTVEEETEAHKRAKEDAVWRVLAKSLCRPSAVEGILQQNIPWSHTHLLPPPTSNQKVTILAADPAVRAFFTQGEAEEIKHTHPHVKTKLVKGADHSMIAEIPYRDVVVQEALDSN